MVHKPLLITREGDERGWYNLYGDDSSSGGQDCRSADKKPRGSIDFLQFKTASGFVPELQETILRIRDRDKYKGGVPDV